MAKEGHHFRMGDHVAVTKSTNPTFLGKVGVITDCIWVKGRNSDFSKWYEVKLLGSDHGQLHYFIESALRTATPDEIERKGR